MNYSVDDEGILKDSLGNVVGKVDYSGRVVKDGWKDGGHIEDDGRYIDEYNRDQGWTVHSIDISSVADGLTVAGLLFLGVLAMVDWLQKWKQNRKIQNEIIRIKESIARDFEDRLPENKIKLYQSLLDNPVRCKNLI